MKFISNLAGDDGSGVEDMPGERFVDKEVNKAVVGDGLRFILWDGTQWIV